ncbi:DUF1415 domain-containing protein [Pseudidiomarina sp. 1APP75-27a]|uniref:DUF1415 domain-containing protein n=1 Tax=Pseudidiomarina terrestris TaxID=2820060 RepID=UPI002B05F55E|nr:DUF1415 domain-containing protein [Pseudidiomarina sp. 1APP75-27a]MEA3588322.1 DUF1415 domain-containing protein [Pseudidiomarina sp. 1APP75-27a]
MVNFSAGKSDRAPARVLTPACDAVREWVERVVVGLNFCPFAHREVERQTIVYQDCAATELGAALQAFADAARQLLANDQKETTLLVLSDGFDDFHDYLELLDYADVYLREADLEGILQVASFHPRYQFAGSDPDAAANYTNRAPYPVLHLLREASLERVLKRYPNPDLIPENNCAEAERRGVGFFEAVLSACKSRANNEA